MFHPVADRSAPQRLKTLGTDIPVRESNIQNTQQLQPDVLIVNLLPRLMAASHDARCHADRSGLFSFKSYLALND